MSLFTSNADAGAALVAELSFSKRLDALRFLAAALFPGDAALIEQVESCVSVLGRVEHVRNRFVHSSYGIGPNGPMLMKSTAKRKRGVIHNFDEYKPTLIVDARKEVEKATQALLDLVWTLQERQLLKANLCVNKKRQKRGAHL